MINKEIVNDDQLPLYEVQEVSLLDAMLILKGQGEFTRESSIVRAVDLIKHRRQLGPMGENISMTGT
jgi:hypothetical protein